MSCFLFDSALNYKVECRHFLQRHIWDLNCFIVLKMSLRVALHWQLSSFITFTIEDYLSANVSFCGFSFHRFDTELPCRHNNEHIWWIYHITISLSLSHTYTCVKGTWPAELVMYVANPEQACLSSYTDTPSSRTLGYYSIMKSIV